MGIFSGIEILFFILGAMTVLFVQAILYLRKRYPFQWYSTTLAGFGAFMVLFTVAWAVSSILEGETRSAGIGILVFGVTAFICFGVARQLVVKDMKQAAK